MEDNQDSDKWYDSDHKCKKCRAYVSAVERRYSWRHVCKSRKKVVKTKLAVKQPKVNLATTNAKRVQRPPTMKLRTTNIKPSVEYQKKEKKKNQIIFPLLAIVLLVLIISVLFTLNQKKEADQIKKEIKNFNLYTANLGQNIFNEVVKKLGKPIKKNNAVTRIAASHSKEMANSGNFALGLKENINKYNIVSFCAIEKIYKAEGVNEKNIKKMPKMIAERWFSSSKPPILNDFVDIDGGVGISCKGNDCYVTLDIFCLKKDEKLEVDYPEAYFYSLYPADLNINSKGILSLKVTSSKPVDMVIVRNKAEFELYNKELTSDMVYSALSETNLIDEFEIMPEYGIVFRPKTEGTSVINIAMEFKIKE